MLNALSVDVEDYFQVSAFSETVSRSSWETYSCRVQANTEKVLDLLDGRGVRATFFVLGWVAARYPELIRDIHRRGHEVASHGHAHETIDRIGPSRFRSEVRSEKADLEDLVQAPVLGYRAPSFSVTRETRWALEVLCEEGYLYDSSVFPVYHDRYGLPDAPRFPYRLEFGGRVLWEFPPSTVAIGRLPNVPIGGGGYLRMYPMWVTRWGLRRINETERQPAMVYCHPWELDPDQPRIAASGLSRLRHYTNLRKTELRLTHLLDEFQFAPIGTVLGLASSNDSCMGERTAGAGLEDSRRVFDESCRAETVVTPGDGIGARRASLREGPGA